MSLTLKFAFWFSSWIIISLIGIYTPKMIPPVFLYFLMPLGLSLMLYGLLLNAIAGRTLKKYGHFDIRRGIKKPERLVTVGIYSCMRHPAQFGSIFFGIGISFLTANIFAILTAGWFSLFAFYFILTIEERETLREFGDEYAEFLRTRKPFSPSLRCLLRGLQALKEGEKIN